MPIVRLALFYYVADGLALNQNERQFARLFFGITGAKKEGHPRYRKQQEHKRHGHSRWAWQKNRAQRQAPVLLIQKMRKDDEK
ncbi:hypothetical protein AB434_0095 [Heyndrickxia coagulans]|uniref:Uncharacterized protein n=1 Tax=Heyndrickxia coagulans TaxID=1398 RepID=A0A0C5C504_HEYCO|nr:hypothetical protein SB48_HM08orf01667 [Heyndrickxia coagulans]AKN52500.1 hypothetical protein AB434_0095 [Heyndrickxia coagulans]KWZ86122.1 hypothetical protein HMPREF3213_00183 [Heyndrickxia coagulans]KYC58818.1 hypothetical protein B4100_2381 [Heyndrickxia coagulans]KYC79798.1 hypothetical protein B4096_2283 [Heyndrickxia coagulans]